MKEEWLAQDEENEQKRLQELSVAQEGHGGSSPTLEADSFSHTSPSSDNISRPSLLNPAAASFTPSTAGQSSAPISMPAETATRSPCRERTTSASSSVEAASSVTPKGAPSPLALKTEMQPEASSSELPMGQTEREHPVRTPSTASSSKGYEPTVLRNLISTACQNGDLERLASLMSKSGGEGDGSNRFTLANQTNPHTGLAPLHYAAQRGHVDVVKWLIEESGALPELEDGDGEVWLSLLVLRNS